MDEAEAMRDDIGAWPTGRLLSVAARVVEGRFHAFLETHGLTHAGLIALHHLAAGPLSQREIAVLCRVTDQTISRTVDHLRQAGHVERHPDDRDRRRMLVRITEAGAEVVAAARHEERASDHLLGALDDYDWFREQLIKLIAAG
ncbi:MarR family winged helix-turn-helix transcriptional regulator [Nonomuraea sp. SBT364]|uniref:MarR family winged helix-turn-helix transcriptional regulator n=1 Tax=Nonomuraea sp. SBT364 TaxID=1580530 RepID=UPI001E5F074D|nr:MarR family transcriptional regulator [Nonomuraea sp. SBT364]